MHRGLPANQYNNRMTYKKRTAEEKPQNWIHGISVGKKRERLPVTKKYGDEYDCDICLNDGKCRANPNNPHFEYDPWDNLEYLDCTAYIKYNQTEEQKQRSRKKYGLS